MHVVKTVPLQAQSQIIMPPNDIAMSPTALAQSARWGETLQLHWDELNCMGMSSDSLIQLR